MGRYSGLSVGGMIWTLAYESYSPQIAALFLDSDAVLGTEDEWDASGKHYLRETTVFSTTAGIMRERLIALGVEFGDAERVVKAAWSKHAPSAPILRPDLDEAVDAWIDDSLTNKTGFVSDLDIAFQEVLGRVDSEPIPLLQQLRYFVEAVPEHWPVVHDLSAVWGLHGLAYTPTFCADARTLVIASTENSSPTIVLTEGSSDADALTAALELLRPHLVGFLNFMDYSTKPEGGVDAVVKGLRAFAAAGVVNRVIGLLDNDLAGVDGMRNIAASKLPSRMKGLQLPPIALTKSYPTSGTEGLVLRDINGFGVSIELFFGEDVLRDSAGVLRPVQMQTFMAAHGAYQASISDKAAVKKLFFEKVKEAKAGVFNRADWADMDLLLGHILDSI